MADNVVVTNPTPNSDYTVATDQDGTAHVQRVKVEFGADGTFTRVSATNPLPVAVSDGGNSITVDGTVQVSDGGNSLTVDGTVAATQSGAWTVVTSDGGNSLTVDGSVSISGTPTVVTSDGGNTLTVDGTVAATQSGVWSVGISDAGNSITVDGAVSLSGTPTVVTSDGGNSLTVDGTVAATQSGTWLVGVSDAGNSITVDGTVGVTGQVVISDGGNSITIDGSIAAGTEYTEGDTDASITGVAFMWEDTSDTLRSVSAAKPLPVNIISGAGSGGTATQDDTAFTAGTTNVTPAGFMFDDTTPDSVDEGDVGVGRMSANRNQYMTIRDAAGNERGVNVTAGNALVVSVSDGGNSITVDGTVAATQSGTWTVLTSDGGNSLTVDGTVGVSGQVVVSDGGNSLTVDGSVSVGNTVSVDIAAVELNIPVSQTGTWTVITSDGGNSLTVDGQVTAITSDGGNSLTVDGTVAATQSGTWTVLTSDGGNSLTVDGSVAVTSLQGVKAEDQASVDADTGFPMLAVRKATPANTSGNDGDYEFVQMSAGRLWVDPSGVTLTVGSHAVTNAGTFAVQPTAGTTGGCAPYKNLDVDETEDQVKGSAGQLFWVHAMNLAATKRYLKIYNNTAAGVSVGTTVPDLTFPLPTMADTNGAGFALSFPVPIAMGTGITIAATTGFADTDTGAPGANEVIVNLGYA